MMNLLDRPALRGTLRLLLSSFSALFILGLGITGCGKGDDPGGKITAGKNASKSSEAEEEEIDGEKLYMFKCASCHLPDGKGIPGQFPPLDGSHIATGDPAIPIRIVLHGLSGPITVEGNKYEGLMPGWGTQLSPAEIAAVLTHVRSEWGNSAAEVTTADVEKVKGEFSGRTKPWTAPELGLK